MFFMILEQDCFSGEICAVFNAGAPIRSMALSQIPTDTRLSGAGVTDILRIALCKSDGGIVILRYKP